jgi:hypothetical protein
MCVGLIVLPREGRLIRSPSKTGGSAPERHNFAAQLTHQELVALRLQGVLIVMRLAGSRSTDEQNDFARVHRGGTFAEQASSIDSEGG